MISKSPSEACTLFTFCPGSSDRSAEPDDDGCNKCTTFVADYDQMPAKVQRRIYDSVAKYICRGLVCHIVTSTLFPVLNGLILEQSPPQMCHELEFCIEPNIQDKRQELGSLKNTGCDICKLIVVKIADALENEENEVKFKNIIV